MRIIKTKEDIELLRNTYVLPDEYLDWIDDYFVQLYEALGRDETMDQFRLDWPGGFIAVLEEGDNLRDLSILGLNYENDGIFGFPLEYVEEYSLNRMEFYRIGILFDNESMLSIFSEVGIHDDEIEDYLAAEAINIEEYDQMPDEEVPF
ncbi:MULTISPECIES: hypothetical protein [Halanaerobium]|jgi:hypothetical protein|uniref:Uncharacterized protein n=2 Tax=Halanaerobium TaxID=2330 RepID=A0A1G6QGN7_9FIRM|nr:MULTISPECIES: hypothetical protein [Halanaerobium]TDP89644.1 hypothetical protein C7957_1235 [Halanaerobium saccharolyticum]SDC91642.1 hypothetical protein SAMN04488597_11823 [Halanaerobium congolense]